jgi:hypothetical protein
MLAPLPSLWRLALAFSRDAVQVRLFMVGSRLCSACCCSRGPAVAARHDGRIGLLLWTVGLPVGRPWVPSCMRLRVAWVA